MFINPIIDRERAERQGDNRENINHIATWHVAAARQARKDADPDNADRHFDIAKRLNWLADTLS